MLGFFNKKTSSKTAEEYLDEFEGSLQVTIWKQKVNLNENVEWKIIKSLEEDKKMEIGLLCIIRLLTAHKKDHDKNAIRRKIFKQEFVKKLNNDSKAYFLSFFEVSKFIDNSKKLPFNDFLSIFEKYIEYFGEDEVYINATNLIINSYVKNEYTQPVYSMFIADLKNITSISPLQSFYNQQDKLGVFLNKKFKDSEPEIFEILKICWDEKQKSQPSKQWLKKIQKLIESSSIIDKEIYFFHSLISHINEVGKEQIKRLIALPITRQVEGVPWQPCLYNDGLKDFIVNIEEYYLSVQNQIGLSYLIWYCTFLNDNNLNSLIGEFATTSYKKIKWYGNLSDKNGNACLFAFTLMPKETGLIYLINIRNKAVNKNIINLSNSHLKRLADSLNLSEDSLLEIATPEYDIEQNKLIVDFGNYTAVISTILMDKLVIKWIHNKTHKESKSVPKEIRENYLSELKQLKKKIKEIETSYKVHKVRLENSYLNHASWQIDEWSKFYINHNFLSTFNKSLIWQFDEKYTLININGTWINEENQKYDLKGFKSVKLWHPIYSERGCVEKWRDIILNNEIRQPFKQAFREIYVLTNAEITTNTYSNRFAAHFLHQHQFSALCKIRGWNYTLQGGWDSHNVPTKLIPKYSIKSGFVTDPVENSLNSMNIFNYLATDQVRFYKNNELLEMEHIPKIVFTETMRDVDLFIGVCSIGNNPEWQDSGEEGQYWQDYAFGNLSTNASTRKSVLEKIIPKLKIGHLCKISDRFLEVKGQIRTYKIHIGSGNILMTPNDQYLCIVPNGKPLLNKIFLPFDDDRTLSIILSKAFLLAEDNKISDSTITSQILRK